MFQFPRSFQSRFKLADYTAQMIGRQYNLKVKDTDCMRVLFTPEVQVIVLPNEPPESLA